MPARNLLLTVVLGCASGCLMSCAVPPTSADSDPQMRSDGTTAITGRILRPDGSVLAPTYRDGNLEHVGVVVALWSWPKELIVPETPRDPVVLRWGKEVIPSFTAIAVRQQLSILPEADEPHNFKCDIKGYHNPSIVPPPPLGKSHLMKFPVPDPLGQITCIVDSKGRGYLVVAPSSLYAIPEKNGVYTLSYPLPPGEYGVRIVNDDYGVIKKTITVRQPGETIVLTAQFKE